MEEACSSCDDKPQDPCKLGVKGERTRERGKERERERDADGQGEGTRDRESARATG